MINYAEDKPSLTHPPRSERQKAVIQGYQEAQQEYRATTSQLSANIMEQARKKYESAITTPDLHARVVKLSEAITLNPKYSAAYYARADAYNNMDSTDAALREVNKAIEFNVNDANYYYLKSGILKNKGQSPAAIRSIETAISLNPGLMQYRIMHALLRINNKEYDQCIKICNEVLQSDKGNEDGYFYRGQSYLALSKFPVAIEDFSKAISFRPNHFLYYRSRGRCYSETGNYTAALADYKKSLLLNPSDAETKKLIESVNKKLSDELTKTRGYVNDVTLDPNVTRNNLYGMEITTDFNVQNMKGINGKAVAYFYFEDGTPLVTSIDRYRTAAGELSSSTDFRPGYHPADFKALKIFLPYNILILPQGSIRLKYQVCIFSYKNNVPVELCRSEFKRFTLNVQYE
ncbi:tetratricopeptide repeat protein [Chitinophaga barathri]|uniref:tetratricopeptide repeat protein n=1 Tax=Chitinophaga barathri TaxID=1647451 RepID=UPI0013C44D45|nr:tetratricopeptide repeat protein [Chitinophaga barathri]